MLPYEQIQGKEWIEWEMSKESGTARDGQKNIVVRKVKEFAQWSGRNLWMIRKYFWPCWHYVYKGNEQEKLDRFCLAGKTFDHGRVLLEWKVVR